MRKVITFEYNPKDIKGVTELIDKAQSGHPGFKVRWFETGKLSEYEGVENWWFKCEGDYVGPDLTPENVMSMQKQIEELGAGLRNAEQLVSTAMEERHAYLTENAHLRTAKNLAETKLQMVRNTYKDGMISDRERFNNIRKIVSETSL